MLSYRRYVDQRWKMTELTYATAVIVHRVLAAGAVVVNDQPNDQDA